MPRGVYKRTKPAWNKGIPCSDETKRKLSIIGQRPKPWMIGNNYAKSQIGQKRPGKGGRPKGGIAWNKGMVGYNSASKNPRWVSDRTKLKRYSDENKNRRSPAYRDWRTRVWKRDGYKCRISNDSCDGRIEAHHILGYTDHPELRYEINNGITLCHFHHPRKKEDEITMIPVFRKILCIEQ